MSLYARITGTGTLSEPKGVPDPQFALPSTVNWMRALAFLVDKDQVGATAARAFYASVNRANLNEHQVNTILEQLLFAVHQCSALRALCIVPNKADVARVGIVAWYYGVYAAASAMVAAQDGSFQDDHAGTAAAWDRQIASRKQIMFPFDLRVSTLVKNDADSELAALLTVSKVKLWEGTPGSRDEAVGSVNAYLSGTVKWYRWKLEESIKASHEFRNLKVTDFRTKPARELRDKRLNGRGVGFLHQAIRYRGKANYREALFLGYGKTVSATLSNYVDDLSTVLDAFVAVAGMFCAKRLGSATWDSFLDDLENRRSFSTAPGDLWS